MNKLCLALLVCGCVSAQIIDTNGEPIAPPNPIREAKRITLDSKLFFGSIAAMAASTLADGVTTQVLINRGLCCETNKLISPTGRTFGARGFAIKSAQAAALAVPEWYLVRRHPRLARPFAIVNYGVSIWFAGQAIHNLGVGR